MCRVLWEHWRPEYMSVKPLCASENSYSLLAWLVTQCPWHWLLRQERPHEFFFFFFASCIELKLWLSEGPALKGLPTNLLTFNFVWQLAYHEYTHTHRYSVLVTILNVCVCFEAFNRMGPQISGISPGYTA